jgi:hypothetical protein
MVEGIVVETKDVEPVSVARSSTTLRLPACDCYPAGAEAMPGEPSAAGRATYGLLGLGAGPVGEKRAGQGIPAASPQRHPSLGRSGAAASPRQDVSLA